MPHSFMAVVTVDQRVGVARKDRPDLKPWMLHEVAADQIMVVAQAVRRFGRSREQQTGVFQTAAGKHLAAAAGLGGPAL